MKKTLFLSVLFLALVISLSFTYSFAENNPVDSIRNTVGGAENVIEDAAKGITNGVKEGTNKIENMGQNTATTIENHMNDNAMAGATSSVNNTMGDYTAQRTTARTTGNNNNFLGMSASAWGWVIMAVLGVAIVALVWYYGKQFNYNSNHNDDNY